MDSMYDEEEKVSENGSNEEIERLDVDIEYKVCCDCDELKHRDEFYMSKYGKLFKCCRVCYAAKFSNKVMENGGSARVPVFPDHYADSVQKGQLFQFMELCGWTYTDGIWWKNGIKNQLNQWDNIAGTKKKARPKPTRKVLATKFDELYKQINEIAFKRSKGMSFADLADIYDCSHTTIRTVYRKYEDERRRN
jgi:hypothetical protein